MRQKMLRFKIAESLKEYRELYELRAKTLLRDKFSPEKTSSIKDSFDRSATHFVAVDENKNVVGTLRIVSDCDCPNGLPVLHHPGFFGQTGSLQRHGEVSEAAFSEGVDKETVFLGLVRKAYRHAAAARMAGVVFNIEESLIHYLKKLGLSLEVIGRRGLSGERTTLPVRWEFSQIESSLRLKNPMIYKWFKSDDCSAESNTSLSDSAMSYVPGMRQAYIARG